ncbi:hypothetical protein [Reyranella soli]|uniref:Uncharacterized protein n=1 Tax=Reyranella soli TaxID=1230389 RepID=A0A512N1K6_9HYPH|nr:hypothetical protein [Reyranella soli]GEP52866.1 hypothetical protein RSO01_00320 [Reyranella soli]
MTAQIRHRIYGTPLEEWIELVPGELEIDAVSLRNILVAGREGFGLSDDQLIDYVRRNILLLLAKGAKPVVGALDGVHFWSLVDYGNAPEEIADAIIGEWQRVGRDPELGDLSFAVPSIYEATIPPEAKADIERLESLRRDKGN